MTCQRVGRKGFQGKQEQRLKPTGVDSMQLAQRRVQLEAEVQSLKAKIAVAEAEDFICEQPPTQQCSEPPTEQPAEPATEQPTEHQKPIFFS